MRQQATHATVGALVFGLFLGAVAACSDTGSTVSTGCEEDADCGSPASAFRCEQESGLCFCRTNDACPAAQFCNTAGFCQDRAGCQVNSDCLDKSLFCDTTTGQCLSHNRCSSDLHCAIGQVCDFARSVCIDGCRSQGDCGAVACRCGEGPCACTGSNPEELSKCQVGTCDPDFCADDSVCRFGELCRVKPDAGTTLKQCDTDYDPQRRPYCDNCGFGGGVQYCGRGANYCLIDTANPGNYFCGADCSQGQVCPRGYACQDVIVVTSQWQCSASNPSCPVNDTLNCESDAQCRRGGSCVKEQGADAGHCAGKCGVDEGDSVGYCSCQVDSDCPQDTCSRGECSISRRSCVNDTDCTRTYCVDFGGAGGCFVGQNCAPSNGLSCLEARPRK